MPVTLDDRALSAILRGLDGAVGTGVARAGGYIVDLAQQLAPVDEGDFRDSIHVEPGETATSHTVVAGGPDAPHAIFVEYGTLDSPAQPTLGPAAAAIDVNQEVAAELRDLIQRSA